MCACRASGVMTSEVVPVAVPNKNKKLPPTMVTKDEEFSNVNFEKMKTLPAAFQKVIYFIVFYYIQYYLVFIYISRWMVL